VSTVESLKPDFTEITARLMVEQTQLLHASLNGTAAGSVQMASVNLDNADVSTKDLVRMASQVLDLAGWQVAIMAGGRNVAAFGR
jgi:hypothetical protein